MSKEQKVGLFFLGGVLAIVLAIEMTVGLGLLHDRRRIFVEYPDVQGLQPGDPVRVGGLKMGKVDTVTLQAGKVRVVLLVERTAPVRRDSTARLDFQALSGSRYIAISLGSPSAPLLGDGDTIHGDVSAGITAMMDRMESVGASVADLAESLNRNQDALLHSLDTMVRDNQTAVTTLLASLASLARKVDTGDGTLARLVNDPTLYRQTLGALSDARETLANLRVISERLERGEGTLGRLMSADDLYDDVREAAAGLASSARNIEELTTNIRDGHGTLGRLVTDDSLYLEAQQAVRELERAATGIEDQAPLSVLGAFVSTLF